MFAGTDTNNNFIPYPRESLFEPRESILEAPASMKRLSPPSSTVYTSTDKGSTPQTTAAVATRPMQIPLTSKSSGWALSGLAEAEFSETRTIATTTSSISSDDLHELISPSGTTTRPPYPRFSRVLLRKTHTSTHHTYTIGTLSSMNQHVPPASTSSQQLHLLRRALLYLHSLQGLYRRTWSWGNAVIIVMLASNLTAQTRVKMTA